MLSEKHAFLEIFSGSGSYQKNIPGKIFERLPFSDIFMVFSKS